MKACEICLKHRNKQKQEPIIPHDIPYTLWTKVTIDIFHLGGIPKVIISDNGPQFIASTFKFCGNNGTLNISPQVYKFSKVMGKSKR